MMSAPKEQMVVGYFTHTPIRISETFLDKMLGHLAGEFEVVFFCGEQSAERHYPCEVHFLGFAERVIEAKWGNILARLRRRLTTSGHRMDVQEKAFVKRFKRWVKGNEQRLDFAFIEYGTSAVVVAPYLAQLGIPYAVNFHGYDASASLGDRAYRERIKRVVSQSNFFVVPSHHLRRRIELTGLRGVPCHVLPYSPHYDSLPQPTQPDAPVVVSLGRLTEKKCPEALVMMASLVLQEIPEATFRIIGGGPLNEETQNLVNELGIQQQVELVGECPHDRGLEMIASASLFVQHSVTSSAGDQEGFPVALAEAAALGKAIVSTYHSGIVENVAHSESGYLVQEHDYEAMAEHVIDLLRDFTRRVEMGEAGRERIMRIAPSKFREARVSELIAEALSVRSTE